MAAPTESHVVRIVEAVDVVRARSEARRIASLAGFGVADQTRLATAVSELARNVLQHAGDGLCEITEISTDSELGIRVLFQDHGAGIPDIDQAMRDGYSTNGGLGAGLPGTFRLMNQFAIESQPGLTRITVAMIRGRNR